MNGSHLLIYAKRKILIDDGEDVPTLGDVCLRFLLANSSDDLMGNLLDRHHPKQSFAFGHCCIDKAGADVGDVDIVATLVCFLAQSFHVVDLSALPMPEVAPMMMMFIALNPDLTYFSFVKLAISSLESVLYQTISEPVSL